MATDDEQGQRVAEKDDEDATKIEMLSEEQTKSGNDQPEKDLRNIWYTAAKDGVAQKRWKANVGLRKAWKDLTQSTSLVGVNKLTQQTPFGARRYFWAIIVLGCIVWCTVLLTLRIQYYYSRPVNVKVHMHRNMSGLFPAVTLCHNDRYRLTFRADLLKRTRYNRDFPMNFNKFTKQFKWFEFLQESGHRIEDMIIRCRKMRRRCSSSDFKPVFVWPLGICYTLSGLQNNPTIRRSPSSKIEKLLLTLDARAYDGGAVSIPTRIRLILHDPMQKPSLSDHRNYMDPGNFLSLGVNVKKETRLPSPYGDCIDYVDESTSRPYTISTCLSECEERAVMRKCNCRLYKGAHENATNKDLLPICSIRDYWKCMPSAQVPCDCAPQCSQLTYSAVISHVGKFHPDKKVFVERWKNATRRKHDLALNAGMFAAMYLRSGEQLKKMRCSILKLKKTIDLYLTKASQTEYGADIMYDKLQRMLSLQSDAISAAMLAAIVSERFVTDWLIADEQTFAFIAWNHQEIIERFASAISELTDHSLLDDVSRAMVYRMTRALLGYRLSTAKRAFNVVKSTYNAYRNHVSTLQYKTQNVSIFQSTYTTYIIDYRSKLLQKHCNDFSNYIKQFSKNISKLMEILEWAFAREHIDSHLVNATTSALSNTAVRLNKMRIFFKNKLLRTLGKDVQNIISSYREKSAYLSRRREEFKLNMLQCGRLIDEIESSCVSMRKLFNVTAYQFLDTSNDFTPMWPVFTNATASMSSIQKLLVQPTSSCTRVASLQKTVHGDIVETNRIMTLSDEVNKEVYGDFVNDINNMLRNDTSETNINDILIMISSTLTISEAEMRTAISNLRKLGKLGDDIVVDIITKEYEKSVNVSVDQLDLSPQIDGISKAVAHVRETMKKAKNAVKERYSGSTNITDRFARENIIKVTVSMREHSYQENKEHVAYDLSNLWSDIGGLTGLFIGASVVTLFEIIDVILHNLAMVYCYTLPRTPTEA